MPSGISPGGRPIDESPLSPSKTDNWVARNGGLPPYVRGIARGVAKSRGHGKPTSSDIAIAWASAKKLGIKSKHPAVRAAGAVATAQELALRARAHARSKNLSHRAKAKKIVDLAIAQIGAGATTPQQANAVAPTKMKKPVTTGKNGKINNWGNWDQQHPNQGTNGQQTNSGAIAGYNGPPLKSTTVEAIRQFQAKNGLGVTGNLDSQTIQYAQQYPAQVAAAKAAVTQAAAAKKTASAATTAANKQAAAQKKTAAAQTAATKAASAAQITAQKNAITQAEGQLKIAMAQAKATKQGTGQISIALAALAAQKANL